MSTIELRNVTKHFGAFTAVKDLSLSVSPGEVVCLLGPSGCGKTTTLRIVAGLERASSGDVVIAGKRMNDLAPDQRNIAMVFQFYALYPALSVHENIMFPLHVERLDAQTASARVARVARMLQLEFRPRPDCRTSSRRGRNNASPSRARWCAIPTASCSMSP